MGVNYFPSPLQDSIMHHHLIYRGVAAIAYAQYISIGALALAANCCPFEHLQYERRGKLHGEFLSNRRMIHHG